MEQIDLLPICNTKYAGVTFLFDGKEYVVPPLSPRQMREFKPLMEAAQTINTANQGLGDLVLQKFVPIIHAAMARNYPELTVDQVADFLDLDTYGLAYAAALGRRAYEAAKFRETKDLENARNGINAGEPLPVTVGIPPAASTGATSTGA